MHTGVVFVIEADSAEDALASIEGQVYEGHLADWSDWSEHAGRWSDVVDGGVLRYSDNPERFNEVVDKFIQSTENEVIEIIKEIGHLTIDELVDDPRYHFRLDKYETEEERDKRRAEHESLSDEEKKSRSKDALALYHAIRVLKITDGHFTSDTHFFDLSGWSSGRSWLDDRIKENPEKQFIVVWDFHF